MGRAFVLLMLATPLLSGCGTIFGGTTQVVRVSSTPTPATVTTQPPTGTTSTPATLVLPRKDSYILRIEQEGYAAQEVPIRQEMRVGILVLDVLFTGLVGVVVDAVTGGWWNLTPTDATIALQAVDSGLDPLEVRVSIEAGEDGYSTLHIDSDEPVRFELVPVK